MQNGWKVVGGVLLVGLGALFGIIGNITIKGGLKK